MEKVFCLARVDLESIFTTPLPQGFVDRPSPAEVLSKQHHFLPRSRAEEDPAYKQIIPYQLFCCGQKYFVFRRGSKVGEQRLSGRLSIGVGGHINDMDCQTGRFSMADFNRAMSRERHEELICPSGLTATFKGWINDDSDAVGRVHLGAVYICKTAGENDISIKTNGEDIYPIGWFSSREIIARRDEFEKWSLLAITGLHGN